MSIKEDKARKLFSTGTYNCAQSVLGAFSEENGLDMNVAFKVSSGFGGGIRSGNVCGAVSSAVMVIGLKCGFSEEGDLKQKGYCYSKTEEFIKEFKEQNNSVLCCDLLEAEITTSEDFKRPEVREKIKTVCPEMVASAVRIIENMRFE